VDCRFSVDTVFTPTSMITTIDLQRFGSQLIDHAYYSFQHVYKRPR